MTVKTRIVALCPGQGAQAVGMGKAWAEHSDAARAIFEQADAVLGEQLGAPLSSICFDGPAERLNQTDVSQPAIFTCSVACAAALESELGPWEAAATAGLSLGEYTALHLAGAFDFETGLRLVAARGRLMQDAAEASKGGMVALIGAEEAQAEELCAAQAGDDVLVCANFNAPGQIVISGDEAACERAAAAAGDAGLRATPLVVAGAFHSPLMQPAADKMAEILAESAFSAPKIPVWSNVTAQPHDEGNMELLRQRLVEQITQPVRWSQSCAAMFGAEGPFGSGNGPQGSESDTIDEAGEVPSPHELAPGSVLRGLMRRIERSAKVTSHDEPRN